MKKLDSKVAGTRASYFSLTFSALVLLIVSMPSKAQTEIDDNFTSIDFPAAIETTAHGINPAGEIVGFYANADQPERHISFLLSEGTFTSFEFPGAVFTRAFDINARGEIVGRY